MADVTVVTRREGPVPDWADRRLAAGGGAAASVRRADVVVTATSARRPVFDGRLVRDGAVVLAVGSHEPDARELDSVLMGRATVVVESRATALREAGDVVMAIHEGSLDPDDLVTLADPAGSRGDIPADRPLVVKTCGMGWQDLVVAVAAHRRKEGAAERS